MHERLVVCPRCGKEARNSIGRFCTACGLALPVTARYEPSPTSTGGYSKAASFPPKTRRNGGRLFFLFMIVMIAGMALLRLRAKSSCVAMPSKVTHSRQSSEFLSPYNVPSYPAEFSTFESEADAEVRFSPIEAVIRQDSYSSRRTLCISGSVFGATDDALLVAAYLPKPNYFSQTEQFQRVEMMVPIGGVRFSQGAAGEARRFELTYPLPANANLNGDPSAVTVVLFDGDRRPIQQNRVSIRQTPTFGKSSF